MRKYSHVAVMPLNPHILIFEPEATGHQMEYLRHLLHAIDAHIANAQVTLLTTEEAAAHPNCERLVNDFSSLVRVRIAPTIAERGTIFSKLGAFYERQWKNAESLTRGIAEIGPDTVHFVLTPHLESIGLLQIGLRPRLFHRLPWATIGIAIRFHHRAV